MPFVRPIIHVYQEYTTVPVVSPALSDLNCCYVGPAYFIQDYPTDSDDIYVDEFLRDGYTKNSACGSNGSSEGRPLAGTTFVTLAEPPNHISGGVLDADSVDVVFDEALIELNYGDDGALSAGSNVLTASTHGDFVNKKVAAGDRVILTKSDGSATIVTSVKEVLTASTLELVTDQHTTVGTTNVRWRIEHELADQHIDVDTYVVVVGNQISINTTPACILLAYEDLTWKVNYAKIYVGYRELRTDLQDIRTLTGSTYEATLGRIDERNPLAAAAQVAFSNTSGSLQFFGVGSDDLSGHQSAIDRMSSRDDVYAIVPLTDPSAGMDTATFLSVISAWKTHCYAYSDPDVAKFRIVIGSYPELPTEKSSAPPSTVGTTAAAVGAPVDVFVDPHANTEFVTLGVDSTNVLDIMRSATIQTVTTHADGCGQSIFMDGYASKELLGAIGEKRLRIDGTIAAVAAQAGDYIVRDKLVTSEGVAPRVTVLSGLTEGDDGTYYTITGSTNDFAGVTAGDIACLTDCDAAVNEDGYRVRAVATPNYEKITLDLKVTGKTGLTVKVRTYRPSDSGGFLVTGCGITATSRQLTKTAGFTSAAVGDLVILLRSDHATQTVGNVGMWVVSAVDPSGNYVTLGGSGTLVNDAGTAINAVFYHTVASRGGASITTRARFSQLRDNTASFLTTVLPGELIEIPYPANVDPTHWDTATTTWPVDEVISNELLAADLDDLEELAPKDFIAAFSGDCSYRIAITLDRDSQVTELNTITTSVRYMRCVMVWPNEVLVTDLENALTGVQSRQTGQYLACALGAAVAGLPSHQGFSFLGVGGIQQIFNSNFYFSDTQLTNLRNGGWYVYVQDSESSLPYSIHEVTTDVTAYELGELMQVKNFDYISIVLKNALDVYRGQYNLLPETITAMSRSIMIAANALKTETFPKLGARLIDATIENTTIPEIDRTDIYVLVTLPHVVNQIGLHLRAQ